MLARIQERGSNMKFKEEYLKTGGVICPFCKSQDIEGGAVEINEGTAQQDVACISCDGAWRDIYRLEAVETIEEPSQ
jgi:hypothetical protein